ncbi:BglG family transcription antiterminator [Brevibacillus laterosporus]|uniref:Helix-turn-helix domain-containing protein n=1 Tax=Brevibacillus laterosporus TaxID=1465 RepID=A0AAP3DF17_BRELA|nr:helix-turn-helix domain-containing protein [Brevibacillus laterosporus]MCR8979883.1 helix-turn-helix domain-containing protein [Brevibacillus laterosporus]MCZ0807038.1 helix-turn-helix domain-containing protein [Brevibacillus laterosporus]MCZ0826472.1 helix-turn-helix domain-containing protein [Brevibacillus laterosporus]MCZ0850285.1 helix-turn-helix domain-containing protein [Brevibacillus laterosporus]
MDMRKEKHRQIQIMKLLGGENRWFTVKELSEKIGCSYKTVAKEISIMKDFLPSGWEICSVKGKGVQLFLPDSSSINEVISLFVRDSFTFQVFQQLLEGNSKTVSQLAENLFIQGPSLQNVLRSVGKHLKTYKLQLQRNPLQIVGNELQIIMMFFELYTSSYTNKEWPFVEYEELCLQYLDEVEEALGITFDVCDRHKLSYYIAILLIRKKQGYQINLGNQFSHYNIGTPYYHTISTILDQLTSDYNISLTPEDKVVITIVIKASKHAYKDIDKVKKEALQYFQEGKIQVFIYMKDFIHMLENRIKKSLIHDEEFVFTLIDYFKRTIYTLKYFSTIKVREKNITKYINEKHRETFLLVKEVYNEWAKKYGIADHIIDDEIANVTMQLEATISFKSESKKALIISGEGTSWKRYMEAILRERFGEKLQVSDQYLYDITEEQIKTLDIDIIITTIPIDIQSIPVIRVQSILSQRNLHTLQQFINDN